MNKKWIIIIALAVVMVLLLTGVLVMCSPRELTVQQRTAQRASQLAEVTLKTFIDAEIHRDGEIYVYDNVNPWSGETEGEASVWHYTSLLGMANRLAAVTEGKEKKNYTDYINELWSEMDWFKGEATITSYRTAQKRTMYAVNRANSKNTANIRGINAVYDDQMWIIKEMLSSYSVTGTTAYLEQAEILTDTCLDGWDDTINPATGTEYGGITWGPGYASKHTCSNAPLISPLIDLYEIYKGKSDTIYNQNKAEYYLNWAKKIYDFSYATFRNSNDLYGDLVGSTFVFDENELKTTTSQGTLDITEYTYNTGTMLQGGAKLYKATGDKQYLLQAQNTAEAAYRIFGAKDSQTGLSQYPTTSTLWFNLQLLIGYVDLANVDDSQYASVNKTYIDSFLGALDYAYDNYYHDGFLPRNYVKGWMYGVDFDQKKNVMDCAASAEMYALLSQYYATIE